MNQDFKILMRKLKKISAYNMALVLFQWDNATAAPKKAIEHTAESMGILSDAYYQALTGGDMPQLLERLKSAPDLTPVQKAIVSKTEEMYEEIHLIPADEYAAYQTLLAKADSIWQSAKQNNDYPSFAPVLKEIIGYAKKFAGYKAKARSYTGPLYDMALDSYEKGFTTEVLDNFFEKLKTAIVPLVRLAVKNQSLVDNSFNFRRYDVDRQKEVSKKLAAHIGFDFDCGILAESAHPFTTSLHNKDVRITTAYFENNLESAMFSTIHEGGHALYEMHIDDALTCTPAGTAMSMGIHESQSRLFENNIGRSRAFWEPLYPMLTETFPNQLHDVNLDQFVRGINQCMPGLIRTEADELTYCLHIMVRYEIEKMIFSQEIDVMDLPKIWNDKYESYLGLRPQNDSEGILQDIHWAGGSFGYFPSYAIGTAIAAQIYAHLKQVMPLDQYLSEGRLSPVNDYLKEHLHRFGASKPTMQLISEMTGEPFNPDYYIEYLKEKYTKLYSA